jgi:hypothetical protein
MPRTLQIIQVLLNKPRYALIAIAIGILLAVNFLYFDYYIFFQPYVIFYIPPRGIWLLCLDIALSALSGLVIGLSAYQLASRSKGTRSGGKLGLVGIFAPMFAGACPCYYLIPILAASAGAGSVLLAFSVFFNTYEVAIKLLSLAILAYALFTLEQSLRASCKIDTLAMPRNTFSLSF